MDSTIKEETDTCTGQCSYSPICRQCELEKKQKCLEAAVKKRKMEENPPFDPEP